MAAAQLGSYVSQLGRLRARPSAGAAGAAGQGAPTAGGRLRSGRRAGWVGGGRAAAHTPRDLHRVLAQLGNLVERFLHGRLLRARAEETGSRAPCQPSRRGASGHARACVPAMGGGLARLGVAGAARPRTLYCGSHVLVRSSRSRLAHVSGTPLMATRRCGSPAAERASAPRESRSPTPDRLRPSPASPAWVRMCNPGVSRLCVRHEPRATMGKAIFGVGDIDLLHPPAELEARKHKLKRKIPTPNSFFMDVKCPGCYNMCALPRAAHPGCPPGLIRGRLHAPRGAAGARAPGAVAVGCHTIPLPARAADARPRPAAHRPSPLSPRRLFCSAPPAMRPFPPAQHDGVLPRTDGRDLRLVLDGALPAHGRQGPPHRGLLLQEEERLGRSLPAAGRSLRPIARVHVQSDAGASGRMWLRDCVRVCTPTGRTSRRAGRALRGPLLEPSARMVGAAAWSAGASWASAWPALQSCEGVG